MSGRSRRVGRLLIAATLLGAVSCDHPTAPDPITAVDVIPIARTLLVGPGGGQTVQLSASVIRKSGAVRSAAGLSWNSSVPSVASVDANGLVTAVAPGTTLIGASVDSVSGLAVITVLAVPVASLALSADSIALEVSPLAAGQHQLAVELRDSTGTILPARPISWTSTAPSVARVSFAGLVTAVSDGTATIRATREGRADSVRVTVTGVDTLPDDADLAITEAQWTQGVQRDDGSLPLIRGIRPAALNVVLTTTHSIVTPSSLVLRLRDQGGAIAWSDTVEVIVPTGTPQTLAAPTAQFLVASSELVPGRTWEVVRDPGGLLPDSSTANDRLPRGTALPLDLTDVPVLRIRFVPIALASHGGTTGSATLAMVGEYLQTLRAIYPLGAVDVTIGPTFTSSQTFGTAPNGGSENFWIPVLGQLDVARVADPGFADAHWIGVVSPPAGFTNVSYGGFAFIPSDGASFGPGTRTSTLVNLGWFTRESATRELVAHELGHNFGRFHAPCGAVGGPDPNYPRPDGSVGPGGHDVAGWAEGRLLRAPAISQGTGDVMGYCPFVWAGRYTYEGVFDFRGSGAIVALRAPPTRTRVILVRGAIADGRITIEPAITLQGTPSAGDATGAVLIEGLAADGRTLFAQRVAMGTIDHAARLRPFSASIAVDAAVEAELTTIRVRGPAGEATRERSLAPTVVPPGRGATVQRLQDGVRISCGDPAAESLIVQDDLTGAVVGMAQAAAMQLRPVPSARLWLSCSDGVRTTTVVPDSR